MNKSEKADQTKMFCEFLRCQKTPVEVLFRLLALSHFLPLFHSPARDFHTTPPWSSTEGGERSVLYYVEWIFAEYLRVVCCLSFVEIVFFFVCFPWLDHLSLSLYIYIASRQLDFTRLSTVHIFILIRQKNNEARMGPVVQYCTLYWSWILQRPYCSRYVGNVPSAFS